MIKFKQKNYTLQEGHYTGPKDVDKIPGVVEVVGKSALGGAAAGGIAGSLLKDTTVMEGAWTGAKWGSIGGILAKLFINYLHKPMTNVKYQEVDKAIRRQFGVYQVSGITVGDTKAKRTSIDEKFSFNDRNVSVYKLNFAVHNGQVTMYTFGLTKEDLDKVNKSLDYYCKKFSSMEYTAKVINQKVNAYSANITFTNYHVISQFIIELGGELNCKINLLDNSAIVDRRITEAASGEEEQKEFSVSEISKYDLMKILGTGLSKGLSSLVRGGKMIGASLHSALMSSVIKLNEGELNQLGVLRGAGDHNNKFLEAELKKLHYLDGFDYTTGPGEGSEVNMSLISGIFLLTAAKSDDVSGQIDENVWKHLKTKIHRSDTGKVVIYTYTLKDVKEFDLILNKLMGMRNTIKPNIFDRPAGKGIKFFSGTSGLVDKIKDRLTADRIDDFEVTDKVKPDMITVDPENLKIYIPRDLEDTQYKIEDEIRVMARFIRTQTNLERNIFVMKLNGPLTPVQFVKLVKFVIEEEGYCGILNI